MDNEQENHPEAPVEEVNEEKKGHWEHPLHDGLTVPDKELPKVWVED